MGLDDNRFIGVVDEDFRCPICQEIIEDPIGSQCEHVFCKICINEWLKRESSCPVDRNSLNISQLCEPSRFFRNFYSKLIIKCEFESNGCGNKCTIEEMKSHRNQCKFNKTFCEKGCEALLTGNEFVKHNCVEYLKSIINKHKEEQEKAKKLESEQEELIRDLQTMLTIKCDEIEVLKQKNEIRPTFSGNISRAFPDSFVESSEHDELDKWSSSLQRARVTKWGGMISTPDASLQESVTIALIDSSCPLHFINKLVENSNERRWPPGLSTLEIRLMNRILFDNYVCRRIPGQQAVVIMTCDNPHMNEYMLINPGLVMIFNDGIE